MHRNTCWHPKSSSCLHHHRHRHRRLQRARSRLRRHQCKSALTHSAKCSKTRLPPWRRAKPSSCPSCKAVSLARVRKARFADCASTKLRTRGCPPTAVRAAATLRAQRWNMTSAGIGVALRTLKPQTTTRVSSCSKSDPSAWTPKALCCFAPPRPSARSGPASTNFGTSHATTAPTARRGLCANA